MKSYETIWEIFNKCPNNQMRDVFIDEVEVADTDAYIRQKFQAETEKKVKEAKKWKNSNLSMNRI